MKLELLAGSAQALVTTTETDLLVVPVFTSSEPAGKKKKAKSDDDLSSHNPVFAALDQALAGQLAAAAAREEFTGKAGSSLTLHTLGQLAAHTVLVLGLGESDKVKTPALRAYAARAARTANAEKAESLVVVAPEPANVRALAEGLVLGSYRFTKYLTGERAPKKSIETATLLVAKTSAEVKAAFKLGEHIGESVCFTRDMVNEPPNVLDAPEMADRAHKMVKDHPGLKITVFDKAELEKRGFRLFLAVNQGSVTPPRLIHVSYVPKKKAKKKLVFVGKAVTFDSGGLCIKPADSMVDMKTDMAGGANVLGLLRAVAALKPDVEVHGIVGATDNMPDGNAYRPGDVFTSLDGKTVEIINTDAEGRLVLADCLTYATSLEPDAIIDNATLTGACIVALGHHCTGWYCNDDDLKTQFEEAAKSSGEQMWRMPLPDDLKELLKSDVADMKHVGGRWGGSITAALFLKEFVGDTPWVHCDIAGPATTDKPSGFYVKGATGHGVLTFLELIEQL